MGQLTFLVNATKLNYEFYAILYDIESNMTSGFIAYTVSAAFMGSLYGALHTHSILRDKEMPQIKRATIVASSAFAGAVINPIMLPFYPFLCTIYSMHGCPVRQFHKYV